MTKRFTKALADRGFVIDGDTATRDNVVVTVVGQHWGVKTPNLHVAAFSVEGLIETLDAMKGE